MPGLMKRIIPCLDVKNGQVVKGIHFKGLREMGDPVELAVQYEREGADEIVFLDITATNESRPTALAMVRRVSKHLAIPFTLGGGLRTLDDIYQFLEAGADKVAVNSMAVHRPEIIEEGARQFGSQCIVVALDVQRQCDGSYAVYTSGGRQKSDRIARTWSQEIADRGAGEILLTSIDRDGTGLGFDMEITGSVSKQLGIPVIASGGAQTPEHLRVAFSGGADAARAATMFHDRSYRIGDVKRTLSEQGIPVRLDYQQPDTGHRSAGQ